MKRLISKTSGKGAVAEAKLLAAFVAAAVPVSVPFQSDLPYDLVADINGRLYRIQVKYVAATHGRLEVPTSSPQKRGMRYGHAAYTNVDMFGVYCPNTDRCYLLPADAATETRTFLRVSRPANGQVAKIRWAEDYEFTGVVAQLGERDDGIV